MKRGLLLINLGTPQDPHPPAVGRYLREFLMDKWVIDVPWIFRWILVNVLIVPRRKHASSELYETIWTERGSPLLFHLQDLAQKVSELAGTEFVVDFAMRYGEPSIRSALERLKRANVDEVVVFPLYPQYAESSSRSSIEAATLAAAELGMDSKLKFVPAFYQDRRFIEPYAAILRAYWQREKPEHLLLSFHGLPERHVKKTDRSGGAHCLKSANCCDEIKDANRDCYRAQSFATARKLAAAAGLTPNQYSVSFQSRLGRAKWIEPYTEEEISALAKRGVRKLAVACPAFVADCLETLEEIGVRGTELFRKCGGDEIIAIPCLNSDPAWAASVLQLASSVDSERGR